MQVLEDIPFSKGYWNIELGDAVAPFEGNELTFPVKISHSSPGNMPEYDFLVQRGIFGGWITCDTDSTRSPFEESVDQTSTPFSSGDRQMLAFLAVAMAKDEVEHNPELAFDETYGVDEEEEETETPMH